MAEKPTINFKQAQAALEAMMQKTLESPAMPVAMAVVDEAGNLLAYNQMDNLRLFSRRHALRKAYTAAITGVNSSVYSEQIKRLGFNISEWGGDPDLTPATGGVVIKSREGIIMGGIGVGGYPSGQRDEELAEVGLQAMNLT